MARHKGDFEIAVQRALGKGVEVRWSDVRVICIAPNYDYTGSGNWNMMPHDLDDSSTAAILLATGID